MGTIHDDMATKCGDQILNNIRSGNSKFKQVFSTSLTRTSDWTWPRPDYVCYDAVNKCTYAIEFKPSNQTKREYLCGLGQALSYLQKHMYSGLILPQYADDGFPIAQYVKKTLQSPEFSDVAISLYEYDPKTLAVSVLRKIKKPRKVAKLTVSSVSTETFWCYWRDTSQYDVLRLLELSFKYNEMSGDIYSNYVFPDFWADMLAGNALNWEGEKRKAASASNKSSQKQNYKISLNQLELWNPATGKLTKTGMKLLRIGKLYGANSRDFLNALAYLILVRGKHLELIKLFEIIQKSITVPKHLNPFLVEIEKQLTIMGYIGARKPTARKGKTTAKPSYIRDEPKVWNKLGLLKKKGKVQYFFPEEGYYFDWHVISDVLIEGQRILSD